MLGFTTALTVQEFSALQGRHSVFTEGNTNYQDQWRYPLPARLFGWRNLRIGIWLPQLRWNGANFSARSCHQCFWCHLWKILSSVLLFTARFVWSISPMIFWVTATGSDVNFNISGSEIINDGYLLIAHQKITKGVWCCQWSISVIRPV